MADADSDGAHIRCLLATLFFRYMRPLVDAGRVFTAVPPLHRFELTNARKGQEKYIYTYSDAEYQRKAAELTKKGVHFKEPQRYKGLGEMDADQLAETTMGPRHRTLRRMTVDDGRSPRHVFDILMGNDVGPRKEIHRPRRLRAGRRRHRRVGLATIAWSTLCHCATYFAGPTTGRSGKPEKWHRWRGCGSVAAGGVRPSARAVRCPRRSRSRRRRPDRRSTGWLRSFSTSRCSVRRWSAEAPKRTQDASAPLTRPDLFDDHIVVGRGHRAPAVRDDHHPVTWSRCTPAMQPASGRRGYPATRRSNDLGVAEVEARPSRVARSASPCR